MVVQVEVWCGVSVGGCGVVERNMARCPNVKCVGGEAKCTGCEWRGGVE